MDQLMFLAFAGFKAANGLKQPRGIGRGAQEVQRFLHAIPITLGDQHHRLPALAGDHHGGVIGHHTVTHRLEIGPRLVGKAHGDHGHVLHQSLYNVNATPPPVLHGQSLSSWLRLGMKPMAAGLGQEGQFPRDASNVSKPGR